MENKKKPQSMMSALRSLLVSAPYASRLDLSGKNVIVTGTAQGSIGFETARTLAGWGASIVITTRSEPQAIAQAIRDDLSREGIIANVDAHPLDLSRAESVAQFAAWYRKTHGDQLDILINNAGIHLDLLSQWKTPHLSADGFEIQWRTNYLGTMHLTHLLLPLLQNAGRLRGGARVINVVSQLHMKGTNANLFAPAAVYNSWTAYGTSKLGLVHATYEIQRRYANADHVQAYCLHPGAVFTNIADKGLAGNPNLESVRRAMAPVERFFLLTPEEGAQTQVYCATEEGLVGGRYFNSCKPQNSSPESQDAIVSKRLWETTTTWINSI